MHRKDAAKVCLYGDHLAGAFEEFCRIIWPGSSRPAPPRGADAEATSGKATPGSPTLLFVKDEKVIGHVATSPVRLSTGSRIIPAHWIVGFMVLPEYRNGLVGPLLIKEVNRVVDCAMSLHVEAPVLRILTGLQWIHPGVLPQYLYVLKPSAVLEHLQGAAIESMHSEGSLWPILKAALMNGAVRWLGGLGLGLGQLGWTALAAVSRHRAVDADVRPETEFDDSYTDLWQSVSGQFGAALVRDRAALEARFGPKMERYRLLACRSSKSLLGYCVLKTKQFSSDARMGNMKVGTIVDCLYDPRQPAVFQRLLDEAFDWFKQGQAHVALCTASFKPLRRVLMQNGFFPIPGNLKFAYHVRPPLSVEAIPLESWHLMRGDSDADQNF